MGFCVQLQILLPEAHPPPVRGDGYFLPEDEEIVLCPPLPPVPSEGEPTIWRPCGNLHLGRVTRLEKLQSPEQFGPFRPFVRAAIGVVSVLRVWLYADRDRRKHHLAPPILIYDWDEIQYPTILPKVCLDLGAQAPPADLDWTRRRTLPAAADRLEHNVWAAAAQDPKQDVALLARLRRHEPVLDPPFFWISAYALATLWDNARLMDSPEWIEVKKDVAAAAFWYGWSAYLRELSAADARVLILFPRNGGNLD